MSMPYINNKSSADSKYNERLARRIGIDQFPGTDIFNVLGDLFDNNAFSFPFYSIFKNVDSDKNVNHRIVVALAGYSKENLNVTVTPDGLLTISGSVDEMNGEVKSETLSHRFDDVEKYQDWKVVRNGISAKSFKRSWKIDTEKTKVTKVRFVDGLLCIDLHTEMPKPVQPSVLNISIE